ncbi:hypothetical protein RND81_09G210300 [Saponaria officinalis]|uniref:holo-[acyl-carrier-protein] synthase n=1 Tax=Saponaria officinalis TaxID=3572 RepID=A0AAW1IP48_SAPOF
MFLSPPNICVRENHLWYVVPDEVKSSSLLNQYMEILSPSEKQSVLRLHEDGHKKRALLARALVRLTIARYQTNSYVDPRSLQFKKNMYGKPEIDWQHTPGWSPPSFHFNISHTSSLIACGITTSPIGIDLEEKARTIKNNVMSFARRFFCLDEVEHLAKIIDPEIQRLEFLKLWTLKEAYVKALGRGFSAAPFNTFRIHIEPPTDRISEDTDSKVSAIAVNSTHSSNKWQFTLLELADTHYAAVCTENNSGSEDDKEPPMSLRVWKTIPLVEDLCMSGTSSVITIGGCVKQLR